MTVRQLARVLFAIALCTLLTLSCAPRRAAAPSGPPPVTQDLAGARALVEADRLGEADALLVRLIAARPGDVDPVVERAKLFGRLGKHAETVALLAPVAGRDPRLLNLLGYAELLAGRVDDAKKHLDAAVSEALQRGRDYAPPHYHLGLIALKDHADEAALREFKTAVEANAQHLEAHYGWIVAAERLGRADEAAKAKEGFARLYAARLAEKHTLDDIVPPNPFPVDRGDDVEWRPKVDSARFTRTFTAGQAIELACRAPAGGSARFTVTVSGGPALLDVVHAGDAQRALWVPHRLELPAGSANATLEFQVRPASRFAALFGRPAPAGAAFSEPGALAPATARSQNPKPNVLLISLDTLRADQVGCYGAARQATPAIDALAAAGVRVVRAEAAASWTLPSHYSMLSGLTPASHGVMPDLGTAEGYVFPDRRLAIRTAGREVMLAEAFAEAGYRTAAVTEDGWVSPKFGFEQGFRVFRAALEGSLPGTLAGTLGELEATGTSGPWFLFVHTYATHQPYHAPRAMRTRFADPTHSGFAYPAGRVPIEDYYRFHTPLFPPSPSDERAFRDVYAGQVLWADGMVAELVAWLKAKGLLEQTVIAVTSDHGEEFFERGTFTHGDTLFEEVTRVPLVISAPGRVPKGRVVDETVSLIDLPATLLDLAGVADKLGDGRSLKPLFDGREAAPRIAFAEGIGHGAEPLSAAWLGRFKFLRRQSATGVDERLFDLARDPGETKDVRATERATFEQLRSAYDAHRRTANDVRAALGAKEEKLDQETLDKLKSLGYVK